MIRRPRGALSEGPPVPNPLIAAVVAMAVHAVTGALAGWAYPSVATAAAGGLAVLCVATPRAGGFASGASAALAVILPPVAPSPLLVAGLAAPTAALLQFHNPLRNLVTSLPAVTVLAVVLTL